MTHLALDVFFHVWNYFGLCGFPRGAQDVASTVEVSRLHPRMTHNTALYPSLRALFISLKRKVLPPTYALQNVKLQGRGPDQGNPRVS